VSHGPAMYPVAIGYGFAFACFMRSHMRYWPYFDGCRGCMELCYADFSRLNVRAPGRGHPHLNRVRMAA